MSVAVSLDALHAQVDEFGPVAYLVTVGGSGAPHIVSVTVSWSGDRLVMGAGRTSARNVAAGGTLTLLWPPCGADGPYSLLVDGRGEVLPRGADDDDTRVAFSPTTAVLHRSAPAHPSGPRCVAIDGGAGPA
jgi:hypothetical protein